MEIYLNSFGSSLHCENGLFVVYHKDGKQQFDPSKIKSITVSKGVTLTTDAIIMAIQNEIDIIIMDKMGEPQGRIWSYKFGSLSTIRRNQMEFIYSKQAVNWIKDIVTRKIDNQIALLYTLASKTTDKNILTSENFTKTINFLSDYKIKVKKIDGESVYDISPALRGWEGIATRRYFDMYAKILPQKYKFIERSQHPARDMVNCLLNYGYGLLYSKIEGSLVKAGVDPYLGVFHRENYNRPVLAFDIIEIFRVWVDYVVADLCIQEVVCEEWFSVINDVYWLENPGKRVLIQSFNDYLYENIEVENKTCSRLRYIELYCYEIARMFENFKE